MRDLLLVLIVFGSVPLTFVRPFVGIVMWHWLSLMNPHRLTWSFAYDLRVAMIVAVTTILAWIASREPKRIPSYGVVWLLALFAAWITLCTVLAIQPAVAYTKWDQSIKILLMTFLTMCLVQSRDRIQIMVWVIVLSLGFYGLRGGVFTVMTSGEYRVWGPADSFIGDNNQLGLALIMTVPLMRYLQLTIPQRLIRWGLWALMGFTVIAILGTYSRGGLVALAVMLGFLWLRTRQKVLTGSIGAGLVLVGLALFPDRWYDRMETIANYDQDQSLQGRFDAWRFAYEMAKLSPVFGGGFSVFDNSTLFMQLVPTAIKARNAHSIYFEVLGESGFVGLVIFLALGLATLWTASVIIRKTKRMPDLAWAENLAKMIQVSVIGYAAAGVFLNLGFYDLYYTLIAVIVATRFVVERELAGQGAAGRLPAAMAPPATPAPALAANAARVGSAASD